MTLNNSKRIQDKWNKDGKFKIKFTLSFNPWKIKDFVGNSWGGMACGLNDTFKG